MCFQRFILQYIIIDSGNGLVPIQHQVITFKTMMSQFTNMHLLPGHNELNW